MVEILFAKKTDLDTDVTNLATHEARTDDPHSVTAAQVGLGTADSPTFTGLTLSAPLITTSTVDGRDVSVDGTKLDGIETAATADQTNAEIKTAYEANANTNEFDDAEQTKLAGIETAATVDQTGAEIKTAYEGEANAYTDTKDTKLSGIDTGAEVNPPPISQADAEAGTATIEETFTAERVKQAITALGSAITLSTEQATTSGSTKDFTGIPAGTKRIIMTFEGVSLDATDNLLVQIGDAGGIETTGYVSSAAVIVDAGSTAVINATDGFVINVAASAALTFSGHMTLLLSDAANNTWIATHSGKSSTVRVNFGGGDKSLTAELDRIRLTAVTVPPTSFDAGAVNIQFQA